MEKSYFLFFYFLSSSEIRPTEIRTIALYVITGTGTNIEPVTEIKHPENKFETAIIPIFYIPSLKKRSEFIVRLLSCPICRTIKGTLTIFENLVWKN